MGERVVHKLWLEGVYHLVFRQLPTYWQNLFENKARLDFLHLHFCLLFDKEEHKSWSRDYHAKKLRLEMTFLLANKCT